MDATIELAAIRQRRKLRRKYRYVKSALEKHRAELVALRRAAASLRELQLFMSTRYRVSVAVSTLSRYLAKLPELGGGNAEF